MSTARSAASFIPIRATMGISRATRSRKVLIARRWRAARQRARSWRGTGRSAFAWLGFGTWRKTAHACRSNYDSADSRSPDLLQRCDAAAGRTHWTCRARSMAWGAAIDLSFGASHYGSSQSDDEQRDAAALQRDRADSGSEFPDEWVLYGNHHDAWVDGASDPLSEPGRCWKPPAHWRNSRTKGGSRSVRF